MKKIMIVIFLVSALWIFSSVSVNAEAGLSQDDRALYEKIQSEFGLSFLKTVDKAIDGYEERMNMLRFSKEKKLESHEQVIEKIENLIQELLVQYPQDAVLPKGTNQRYLVLSYIKFELMMINFNEQLSVEINDLKQRLTSTQFEVTQNGATEKPFVNKYYDHFEEGIYVDIIDGTALFSSTDKYKTNTGWPAFTGPISKNVIDEFEDLRYDLVRTEVKWSKSWSHLGHVFTDGPIATWGLRYCINSASLVFIPKDELLEKGYGDYLYLFE